MQRYKVNPRNMQHVASVSYHHRNQHYKQYNEQYHADNIRSLLKFRPITVYFVSENINTPENSYQTYHKYQKS